MNRVTLASFLAVATISITIGAMSQVHSETEHTYEDYRQLLEQHTSALDSNTVQPQSHDPPNVRTSAYFYCNTVWFEDLSTTLKSDGEDTSDFVILCPFGEASRNGLFNYVDTDRLFYTLNDTVEITVTLDPTRTNTSHFVYVNVTHQEENTELVTFKERTIFEDLVVSPTHSHGVVILHLNDERFDAGLCYNVGATNDIFTRISDNPTAFNAFCIIDGSASTQSIVTPSAPTPPILTSIGDRTVIARQALSIPLSASDTNTGTLLYSITSGPGSMSGSTYSWTPATPGNYSVTLAVTNTVTNLIDSETIIVTVSTSSIQSPSTPTPPILTSIGDREVTVGETLRFTLSATDTDSGILSYSKSGVGILAGDNYRYTPATTGTYSVTFTVTNTTTNLTDSETITIRASEPTPDPTPDLSGTVYRDTNGNRVFDAGELGVAGITIRLLQSGGDIDESTTTNSNGEYSFDNLSPGTYHTFSPTFTTITFEGQPITVDFIAR